ncbi:MAG TPA: hypothetical protein VHY37_00155 [Tepidisphaeraceae bacterium]|jgi:MFS-type transporter involved in bile tolerance (Atg22 family)|nr:hypothetical protein [Tepidisphaeraceae bacterium]
MWHQYRKTLIPIQFLILAVCAYGYFRMKLPILSLFYYFAVMQVFAVLGAMWSTRLRRKFQAAENRGKLRKLV